MLLLLTFIEVQWKETSLKAFGRNLIRWEITYKQEIKDSVNLIIRKWLKNINPLIVSYNSCLKQVQKWNKWLENRNNSWWFSRLDMLKKDYKNSYLYYTQQEHKNKPCLKLSKWRRAKKKNGNNVINCFYNGLRDFKI